MGSTTEVLDVRDDLLIAGTAPAAWLESVIETAGLSRALSVIEGDEVHRVEVLVDDRIGATVEVRGDLGQPCAVEVAAAVAQRAGAERGWRVRLSLCDDDGDLLVREWSHPLA